MNMTISANYVINKATPMGLITLTSVTVGTQTSVSAAETNLGDGGAVYTLYRDGINVSNPDVQNLSVGSYTYTYNVTGSENYSAILLDTKILTVSAAGGGGGGGGGGDNTPTYSNTTQICLSTLQYIKVHGQNLSYVQQFIDGEKLNNRTYTVTQANDFITNWQKLCSDVINVTLKEDLVCRKVYYMLVNTNNSVKDSDLTSLKQQLNPDINVSIQLLKYYSNNYKNICQPITKLRLPWDKPKIDLGEIFDFSSVPSCYPDINKTIVGYSLDTNIPFFNIYLGSDVACSSMDLYRWIVNLEKTDAGYYINGLKLWWLIFALIMFLLYDMFISHKVIKSFIKK